MAQEVYRKVLARAAAHLGGAEQLAAKLQITHLTLRRYLVGEKAVPDGVFLQAVDIIVNALDKARATEAGPASLRGRE